MGTGDSTGPVRAVAINATMDRLHVPTSRQLLQAGYDVLLEKPIGISAAEVLALQHEAGRRDRTVMICHVLRFAPFYAAIRPRIVAGEVGDIINIQLSEHVSYHHIAMGFVRGKWNTVEGGGSTMLMSKSCHDLDLLTWFKSGIAPRRVTSFGSLMYFRPDHAPAGAGARCLVDCAIESTCPYSARRHYLEQNLWGAYVWHGIEHLGPEPTMQQKIESLRTDNPFGRCVWRCDNTVVDHQSVVVEFADGATGTLNTVRGRVEAVPYGPDHRYERRDRRCAGGWRFRRTQTRCPRRPRVHGGAGRIRRPTGDARRR